MKSRTRYRWTSIFAAGVLSLLTSACGIGTGSSGSSATGSSAPIPELSDGQQVSIVFESYNLATAGASADTIKGLIADFEKAHPNIHVTGQPPQASAPTDYAGSVQAQEVIGKTPDVAQLTYADLDFAVNGLKAKSLDSLIGKPAVQAQFGGAHPYAPTATKLGDYKGETYGIPYVFSTPVLFINATLFRQAGLDPAKPPTTWAEVEQDALAISKIGKQGVFVDCLSPSATDWCWQSLVKSNGGKMVADDGKTLSFADSGAVGAAKMVQDLAQSGAMPNLSQKQSLDAMSRGNLGMLLESSAVQGTLQGASAAGGWELGTGEEPSFGTGPAVPTNSGSALFVFSDDPAKQRAGWELIQFMTSDHAYTQISSKIGYLPLRTSLVDDPVTLKPWAAAHPLIKPNLAQLSRLQPWTAFPGDSYTKIVSLMMDAVQTIVFQGKDPASTLADAQKRAQDLVPA